MEVPSRRHVVRLKFKVGMRSNAHVKEAYFQTFQSKEREKESHTSKVRHTFPEKREGGGKRTLRFFEGLFKRV